MANSNSNYRKIAKGVYQTGKKSFLATKRVNGVVKKAYATNKTAAIKAYKTL